MANIIQIKRRTSGSAGAPGSLAAGELAYNEVDNKLYYGSNSGVIAIAGEGFYTTVNTSQTLSGSKTFSSSVVLSSAVAETKATATSASSVATTQFVQNVFSLLDGGDFDEGGGGGGQNQSGFVIAAANTTVGGGIDYNDPTNWTFNGQSTATLPTSSDVATFSGVGGWPTIYINIDGWVAPAMIVLGNNTNVYIDSSQGNSFSMSILSTGVGNTNTVWLTGNAILTN